MSKNEKRVYMTLVVLLIVFSVIAFAVPFAKTSVFWLAYIFSVLAITFQIYVLKLSFSGKRETKSKFYGFPIARVGVIYLITQLLFSFIEMALAAVISTWIVVIINVILAAFAVIGCIAVDAMRDEIERQDDKLKKDVSNMRALQSMSATLVGQCSDAEIKKIVERVADEFRFSDPVSSDQTRDIEMELQNQMNEIQQAIINGDFASVKSLCGEILISLAKRNSICAMNK